MHRCALFLTLLLSGAASAQTQPVAQITTKARADVGELVIISTRGTISDQPAVLRCVEWPSGTQEPQLPALYTVQNGNTDSYFGNTFQPPAVGIYRFQCLAIGYRGDPESLADDVFHWREASINVGGVTPTPTPGPTPDPTPGPTPGPTPTPPPAPSEWGPATQVVIVWESAKGQGPWWTPENSAALTQKVPYSWMWVDDDELNRINDPTWVALAKKAVGNYRANPSETGQILYAFDAKGGIKQDTGGKEGIRMDDRTPAQALEVINSLSNRSKVR